MFSKIRLLDFLKVVLLALYPSRFLIVFPFFQEFTRPSFPVKFLFIIKLQMIAASVYVIFILALQSHNLISISHFTKSFSA